MGSARFWRFGMAVALSGCAAPALAATKSLTFSDGICEYRVAFDPAKIDRKRLKDTFDYLHANDTSIEIGPPLSNPEDVKSVDIAAYRADCATHRRKLEAPRFIDLPGVEELRKQEVAELDDSCKMTEAKLRAAKGDADALKTYEPAASCSRFVDMLKLPPDKIVSGWRKIVEDLCHTSTEPRICTANLTKDTQKSDGAARSRLLILTVGWTTCANANLLLYHGGDATAAETPSDREKHRLKDVLLKQFKAKTLSCAQ